MNRPVTRWDLLWVILLIAVLATIGGYGINHSAAVAVDKVASTLQDTCTAGRTRLSYDRYDGLHDHDTPYWITEASHQMRDCDNPATSGHVTYLPDVVQDRCTVLLGKGQVCDVLNGRIVGSHPLALP